MKNGVEYQEEKTKRYGYFLKLSDGQLGKKLWGTPSIWEEVTEHLPLEICSLGGRRLDKDLRSYPTIFTPASQ